MVAGARAQAGAGNVAAGPLQPLAFLAGHCWTAQFPDGKATDTHCFDWVHGGTQLRDRHVVRGEQPDYRGETLFLWDPETQRIIYRYVDSTGGRSDGYVEPKDGFLSFPADRYVGADGARIDFVTEWRSSDAQHYEMRARQRVKDALVDAMLLRYTRADATAPAAKGDAARDGGLAAAVAQLRHARGRWHTTTSDLAPDGTVARVMEGSYTFDWIVEDRLLQGRSDIPELRRSSGILFYVSPARATIEMVSVGGDGELWVMSGPAGSETRTTMAPMRLRFTRFNVEPDRFESRMEYSADEGATWVQGNHQIFVRER